MNKHARFFVGEFKKQARNGQSYWNNDSYMSSGHAYYDVSVPDRRTLCTTWLGDNPALSLDEFTQTLDDLYRGDSYEERSTAGMLLSYCPDFRVQISHKQLDVWLEQLVGWGEIDSTCQSTWTAEELLTSWSTWKKFLSALSRDPNINKRRASLVLLTGPVAQTDDARLRDLSFTLIARLQHERDILITKAVSWLLRSMVRHHAPEVTRYLEKHRETLPAIALRETRNKIRTGKK